MRSSPPVVVVAAAVSTVAEAVAVGVCGMTAARQCRKDLFFSAVMGRNDWSVGRRLS